MRRVPSCASATRDLPGITLDLGASAGAGLFRTWYETARAAPPREPDLQLDNNPGEAPPRTIATVHLDASLGASRPLHGAMYLWAELALQTHFFRLAHDTEMAVVAHGAGRALIGIGVR